MRMFAWRKKSDRGFEWHQYIRTAVRARREARRERVDAARRAAGQHINAAGVALAQGSRAAGSAARDGAIAGAGALGLLVQNLWSLLVHLVRTLMRPILGAVARPTIGIPVALAGAVALGATIGRYRSLGFDREAAITLIVGIVLAAALLPTLSRMTGWRLPQLPNLPGKVVAIAATLALAVAGIAWFATGGASSKLAGLTSSLPFVGGTSLQGRAYATGPDSLRIGNTVVKLSGVEAPEAEQRCGTGARVWRCGATAEAALARLVSGRTIACSTSGEDSAGRTLGRCSYGDKDVAAELVRQGYVFADGTFLARYGSQEREARAAKAGIWSAGDVERPAAFRAKIWEEAKRRAPEGCPIKGQVTGAARTYVLPWSPEYGRLQVQKTRGERWFCSEQEAVAAGFKAAPRG
jgi:endonuclease YncB( thermonuclease family)